MTLIVTNSRTKDFQTCARLHQIRYEQGYRPLVESEALDFGSLMHSGLESWWKQRQAGATEWSSRDWKYSGQADPIALAKAQLLMVAYDARWSAATAEWEVLGVEEEFCTKLSGASGRALPGVERRGKLDVRLRKKSDGTVWFMEHKTMTSDLSPGGPYWAKLRMDGQISTYYAGAASLGHAVAGCIYDVIRRPDIRPLTATPVHLRKYTKATANEPSRLYANQRETDETLAEFSDRLTALIADDPSAWFQRAEVVRLPEELAAFEEDARSVAAMMRLTKRLNLAPRNPSACFQYGKPCAFWDHCTGAADLNDETRFRRLENVHPELSSLGSE